MTVTAPLSRLTSVIAVYWRLHVKSDIASGVPFSTMVSNSYNVLNKI